MAMARMARIEPLIIIYILEPFDTICNLGEAQNLLSSYSHSRIGVFPSVEIPPQPGVDRDVQCHVPSSNGSQWVLCHLAGQPVLWNRGEEYRMGLWTSNSEVDIR